VRTKYSCDGIDCKPLPGCMAGGIPEHDGVVTLSASRLAKRRHRPGIHGVARGHSLTPGPPHPTSGDYARSTTLAPCAAREMLRVDHQQRLRPGAWRALFHSWGADHTLGAFLFCHIGPWTLRLGGDVRVCSAAQQVNTCGAARPPCLSHAPGTLDYGGSGAFRSTIASITMGLANSAPDS
jgi:hypothetical protein